MENLDKVRNIDLVVDVENSGHADISNLNWNNNNTFIIYKYK